ncbi:MAG: DUF4905 domain-containing protein [Chlorobi bacterium]|nr:DUF4905 domain-containing protein [Chlorobiota bacterium]
MDNRGKVCRRWMYSAGENTAVWQFMFTGSGRITGQKRNRKERRSLFFSIDELSGQVLFDDYLLFDQATQQPVGESWFTGMETVSEQFVFLHAWQQNSPEHIGLWAVDPDTGSVVWARRDVVCCGMLDEGLLVYNPSVFAGFPERSYLIIDSLTGIEIRRPDNDTGTINALRSALQPETFRQNVILPDTVVEGSAESGLIREREPSVPAHCECIVSGPLVAAAFHEFDERSGLWRSLLRIWWDRDICYQDILAERSERPAVSSFLLRTGVLYYLRNETELIALDV